MDVVPYRHRLVVDAEGVLQGNDFHGEDVGLEGDGRRRLDAQTVQAELSEWSTLGITLHV